MGRTDFLFATPTLLTGAGRVLDLGGALEHYSYNYSLSPEEADALALANDWKVVGQDLAAAAGNVKKRLMGGAGSKSAR